jgi:hypothetical protein
MTMKQRDNEALHREWETKFAVFECLAAIHAKEPCKNNH